MHLNERKNRNMIKDNMIKVIFDNSKAQRVREKEQLKSVAQTKVDTHKNYGKVPNYINKYN